MRLLCTVRTCIGYIATIAWAWTVVWWYVEVYANARIFANACTCVKMWNISHCCNIWTCMEILKYVNMRGNMTICENVGEYHSMRKWVTIWRHWKLCVNVWGMKMWKYLQVCGNVKICENMLKYEEMWNPLKCIENTFIVLAFWACFTTTKQNRWNHWNKVEIKKICEN